MGVLRTTTGTKSMGVLRITTGTKSMGVLRTTIGPSATNWAECHVSNGPRALSKNKPCAFFCDFVNSAFRLALRGG